MTTGGCTVCGSTQSVKLGGKYFCANCGLPVQVVAETPPPGVDAPVEPITVSAGPLANRPIISDLRRSNPSPSGGQVLDLRANQTPKPQPVVTPPPATAPRLDISAPSVKTEQIQAAAQTVTQSPQISKFAAPTPAASSGAAAMAAPAASLKQVLPNAAASAHEAMQKLLSNLPSTEIAPTALSTEVKSAVSKTSLAMASVLIAVMGAYIWFTNYPKMAVKLAGARAGLEASYPAFLPSSYKLSGAVGYGSGEVTYKLNSPSASSPLTITQRQTSWDSKSLEENYVKHQAADATTVNGQGLTLYFYNDQATWVNHGIWYIIEGTGRLNQDQILKITYSL